LLNNPVSSFCGVPFFLKPEGLVSGCVLGDFACFLTVAASGQDMKALWMSVRMFLLGSSCFCMITNFPSFWSHILDLFALASNWSCTSDPGFTPHGFLQRISLFISKFRKLDTLLSWRVLFFFFFPDKGGKTPRCDIPRTPFSEVDQSPSFPLDF